MKKTTCCFIAAHGQFFYINGILKIVKIKQFKAFDLLLFAVLADRWERLVGLSSQTRLT